MSVARCCGLGRCAIPTATAIPTSTTTAGTAQRGVRCTGQPLARPGSRIRPGSDIG